MKRVPAWLRRHPAASAALVYALLALLMVGQGLLPGRAFSGSDILWSQIPWQSSKPAAAPGFATNYELADSVYVFQPFLRHSRERLGDVPLWNPQIQAGRPFVGNIQSAVFSPFSVPSYILPFWKSLAIAAFLKLFLAAFGTYLFARSLGMRFGGALLSGVVFAFGTFFIVWLAWPLTSIWCFLPYLLLMTDMVIRRPAPLPVAGLAALVGVQFLGGHPESNFHVMFAVVVWFAFRLLWGWREQPERRVASLVRPTLAFGGALALGLVLAAVALLPFAELLLHSGDLSRRLGNQEGSFWPRRYLLALFLHDYWGRPTQTDTEAFMSNRGWYAGGLTLMLAAAALLIRPTATRVAFALFGAFSACMVVGIPPVFDLVTHLPGFKTSHNERMLIFVLLGLAMLAGFGLDDLSARELPGRARRQLVVAAAAVTACIPIVWMAAKGTLSASHLGDAVRVAWGFERPDPIHLPRTAADAVTAQIIETGSLLIWLPIAAVAFALIAWHVSDRRRLAAGTFAALAVTLVAADLFRANLGYNPAVPTEVAEQRVTPAISYLQSRRPQRFVGLGTQLFAQPMPADTAMEYGLYDARGYDYPVEKHFDRLWRRSIAPTVGDFTQPVAFAERSPAAIRGLSLLSVSDLMAGPLEKPVRAPGLRVAYRGPDAVIYANDRALPHVFLVDRQRTVPSENAALDAVTAPGFDGRRVAVTQRPIPGLAQAAPGAPVEAGGPGSARFVHYGDERVAIQARAARPSLLVLTDLKYPGWKATVDGREVPIERVNYLQRGIALPAGAHRVEMRYEPASWRAAWIVSVLALAALAALLAVGLRARRRPAPRNEAAA